MILQGVNPTIQPLFPTYAGLHLYEVITLWAGCVCVCGGGGGGVEVASAQPPPLPIVEGSQGCVPLLALFPPPSFWKSLKPSWIGLDCLGQGWVIIW